jgi:alpha-N-arabinofuranosidase
MRGVRSENCHATPAGTWYDATPGTSALYPQNTLRDAFFAALHFHVFHRHAARLRMANIAQTVNVLQAMVLTQGDAIVLTPTYHLFKLYIPFQDATSLPVSYDARQDYAFGDYRVPAISATVQPAPFERLESSGDTLTFTLPAKSILMIALDE